MTQYPEFTYWDFTGPLAHSRLGPIGMASAKASVLLFAMDGIQGERVGRHLDRHAIAAVISGHHCDQPGEGRLGLERTVRPSLAFYNTRDEIDSLVRVLHELRRH